MDPLSMMSTMVGMISLARELEEVLFSETFISRHTNFVKNDIPTLIAFLNDIKNSFLNCRDQPPAAAESSVRSCEYYLEHLKSEIHPWFGPHPDRRMKVHQRWRIHLGHDRIHNSYRSFKESVLLLKDVCRFFMVQELGLEQAYDIFLLRGQATLQSMLVETQRIPVDDYELGNRPESHHALRPSQESQSMIPHTNEHKSKQAYQDEVDDGSILRLQRRLQREYPDKTVFAAVVCPEVPEGQPVKMVVALAWMDSGSEVNVVSEKYLEEVGLAHLITEIPEDEQIEMSALVEAGPGWKFKRKFTSRFFLYSSRTMETAEFFVTKSSDFDILISQKQYARISKVRSSPKQKLLWMSKKKRSPREEAEQREFERRRQKELENLRTKYDERENIKRIHQIGGIYLRAAGRAWTIDGNARAVIPVSMLGGNGEGSSSMRMNSMEEQSPNELREASIKSGTMEDGSGDGS